MNIKIAVVLVGVALLLAGRPVVAHHAFAAEFDAAKPVKLTGAVTKIDWTNPHAWIYIDAKDETGTVGNWGFELGSPNGLMRTGWRRTTLKPGDQVTIEGSRAKNGSLRASVQTVIVTSTGQKLFSGTNQEQQP
ncbi:MAG: hypothetical protein HW394_1490 [Acidobacteria bacterium]|nr:hypothetical protein [Acidobacteriota bacterium]